MDDLEDSNLQLSRYLVSQKDNTADTPNVDESHIYKLSRKFVRIEYPGLVKNVPKALETLGGIYNVETTIADPKKKLELKFHPENRYNKPCFADRDNSPGLLLKVEEKDGEMTYDILGYTSENFKFNKAADFQYLPLVQDDKTGEVEYVHDKIFPDKMPTLDFLVSKESASQPTLLLPQNFGRYETTHHTLYLKAEEKFNLDMNARPELFKMFQTKPMKKHSYRRSSCILNMNDANLVIPQGPNETLHKLIKKKILEDSYKQVKNLFKERPIWTKAAVLHKTGMNAEAAKIILPAVAYYWVSGPWRTTWTRFGFDPREDFNNRVYQILDYRIRAKEGTKLKVKAKRAYMVDSFSRDSTSGNNSNVDESHYVLRTDTIPPARQMFYQYCDIKIPEVQDMLQRLPKTPSNKKCDIKTGWLPTNFTEQCREIVNRYVIERVRQELVEDSIKSQSNDDNEEENPLAFSGRMLDVMKKGSRRNLDKIGGTVILSDDESGEDVDVDDAVNSIPERMEDNSDVDDLSDDSEMELDMEAVEDINRLIFDNEQGVGE